MWKGCLFSCIAIAFLYTLCSEHALVDTENLIFERFAVVEKQIEFHKLAIHFE